MPQKTTQKNERITYTNLYTEPSKNFGFKGVQWPDKKRLNEFLEENQTFKDDLFTANTDEKKAPNNKLKAFLYEKPKNIPQNTEKDYLYPACWDNCEFCVINGIDDCMINNDENEPKCKNCFKDLNILSDVLKDTRNKDYYKTSDTFYKPFKSLYKKNDESETSQNDFAKSLSLFRSPSCHNKKRGKEKTETSVNLIDKPKTANLRRFNSSEEISIIDKCFTTNSIQFFIKNETHIPVWQKTFQEYLDLIEACNVKNEPALTKFICESKKEWQVL